MMTYLSEELYQKLPSWQGKSESICIAQYPLGNDAHIFEGVDSFNKVIDVITDIRKILGSIMLPPKSNPPVFVSVAGDDKDLSTLISSYSELISSLAKVGEVKIVSSKESNPKGCMSVLSSGCFTVNVEIIKFIKVEDEIKKIQKLIDEKQKPLDALKKKITGKDYASKVPEEVQIKEKEKMDLYEAEMKTLQANIDTFKKML